MGRRKWRDMPYIEDRDVYAAVMFARRLRREMSTPLAVHKAAKYYGVAQADVAYYMGQAVVVKNAAPSEAARDEHPLHNH